MSDLQRRIANLSPEKRALLEQRLREGRAAAPETSGITRRVSPGPCPASFAQARFWFLGQLDPDVALYNVASAFRLSGRLDAKALGQSLDALVVRHESLRTTLVFEDGAPMQVIGEPRPAELQVIDLGSWPREGREAEMTRLFREEAGRSFDLSKDLMLRAVLARLDEEEACLLLTTHHIFADGWSLSILLRELGILYDAFVQGRPSPLPDPPLQYADYAVWQREWFQGPVLESQLAYWKRQLAGAPALLELPTDTPRAAATTHRGARFPFVVQAPLVDELKALGRRHGTTLFMTLLAALQTLLHRYSGQEDIVVGSPIAGRIRTELEDVVGLCLNTLALRTSFADDPTFRELLGRVRETTLGAYGHQDLPFERLVEELHLERTLAHNPLFQVMFTFHNTPPRRLLLDGLTARPITVDAGVSKFDLGLSLLRETPEGLKGRFDYRTDLFEAASITRLVGHFETLLRGIVADPDRRVSTVPLLTAPERRQLLVEWNATRAVYPRACVHQLIEAQVDRSPDAVAVSFDGVQLTYRDLDARANQLARHLQAHGVASGELVGICTHRSLDLLVGVLGILKAGAAYVPLDPTYPPDRLAFMLEHTRVRVLVTHRRLDGTLPPHTARTVYLDAEQKVIARESPERPASPVGPSALAYVMSTSGSTGRPKGVQIPHRAVVNFLTAMRERPGLTADDRLLAVTTLSFDIAGLELFLPLTVGAQVVLASEEVAADGAQLSEILRSGSVTAMQATPATWRLLLEAGWPGTPGLKILCGGEAMPGELARALCARSASVWNLYGPTETTIWSTVHRVGPAEDPVPIGRPIANTELYVLDGRLEPVPVGITGELYIGGVGLAEGYLRQPELTAERFVAHPFGVEPGARLYRTGDRVRYLPTGDLQYLGRIDHQVKLRGFRIELGEIEAVLEQHLAVRQAVAVLREDRPGDQRLVAYVLPADPAPGADELRGLLKQRLPSYMVPSAIVMLERVPLTASGKVDRRALPPPVSPDATAPETGDLPSTPMERLIAETWRELLGVDRVGVQDNFFDLGGHSLLAMQFLHRMEKATGIRRRPRALFLETLGQLALAFDQQVPEAPKDRGLLRRVAMALRWTIPGIAGPLVAS